MSRNMNRGQENVKIDANARKQHSFKRLKTHAGAKALRFSFFVFCGLCGFTRRKRLRCTCVRILKNDGNLIYREIVYENN